MSAINPWTRPHFKVRSSLKVQRALASADVRAREDTNKTKVRKRDKFCRFVDCGCYRFKLALHVSHQEHKGAGGNPKGERSHPDLMLLVCSARHRENRISIDNKTLRWRAIGRDAKGNVLIAWDVDERALKHGPATMTTYRQKWIEIARETALHIFEPLTPHQAEIVTQLRTMTI